MENELIREIFYYKNYYLDFFEKQKTEVKKKFNWTLQLIATVERVLQKYFKHIIDSKENAKNTPKRNCISGKVKKGVFR